MTVKALYDYDYPAKDRQEVYGDDILVNVMWTNNMMFCSAACFRAPKAMSFADFKTQMIDSWAASDPDYDPSAPGNWQVNGADFSPDDQMSLNDTGVGHKGLITFRT
jgi:phenol hydroxylase P4 protein